MKYLMRARPSPAMVVALIALFIALGGTAVALSGKNTVQSDDIGPGAQVKAADIANDAVGGATVASDWHRWPAGFQPHPKLRLAQLRPGPRHGCLYP